MNNQSFDSLGNDPELQSVPFALDTPGLIDMDLSGDNSTIKNQTDSPDRREKKYYNFEKKSVDCLQVPDVSANPTASFHDTGISSLKDSKSGRNISLSISPDDLAKSIDRSPVNPPMPRGTRSRSFRNGNSWDKAVTVSKDPEKNRIVLNATSVVQPHQTNPYFKSFNPRVLAYGHFGATYEVDSKEFGKHAVKKLQQGKKELYIEKDVFNHETLGKHPNVVELYRAFVEQGTLFLQMELCLFSCKSLEVFFTSCNENCNSQWLLLSDCCKGLYHLHLNGVVHLDVKPDNILLGSDWNFKLCDFGCSAKNEEEFVPVEHVSGAYEAPELRGRIATNRSDVYALGTCIWHLSNKEVFENDKDLADVVWEMRTGDYRRRPNASEILKMEIVASKDIALFRNDLQATLEDAMERNSKRTEETPDRSAFFKVLGQNNLDTSTPKPSITTARKPNRKLFFN